jgi:TonB family protein
MVKSGFATVLIAFFVLMGLQCHPSGKKTASAFSVASAEGDCFMLSGAGIKAVRTGMGVSSGDTLLCAFNGKMKIAFNDSDYIVMDNSTKAVILADDKFNVRVAILHGRVYTYVVILPKIGSFKTTTSQITTSVRGTSYTVEVGPEETAISVLEGTVNVMDNDSLCPIQVNRGERAVVNPGQFPCRIKTATLQELKDLVKWVGKSFVKFRKIMEYQSDVQYISKLTELDVIPKDFVPGTAPQKTNLALKGEESARPAIEIKKIEKPKPVVLAKVNLPADSLRNPLHIRQLIGEQKPILQQLYNQCLRREGPFRGRVIIRFIIQSSGHVTEPSVVSSSTGKAVFDSLLAVKVLQLKFEPVRSIGDISIVYPFDFSNN